MSRLLLLSAMVLAAVDAAPRDRSQPLDWPETCAEIDGADRGPPAEVQSYSVFLEGTPAGYDLFKYWRLGDRAVVALRSEIRTDLKGGQADYRHCREEIWESVDGERRRLIGLRAETNYTFLASFVRPDSRITITRNAADDGYTYAVEEKGPIGQIFGWSRSETAIPDPATVNSMTNAALANYGTFMDVFKHRIHRASLQQRERRSIGGLDAVYYDVESREDGDDWKLWYGEAGPWDGRLLRLCGRDGQFDEIFEVRLLSILTGGRLREIDASRELLPRCDQLTFGRS